MLNLMNLKRKFKDVKINDVDYQIKKFTVGVASSLFVERYEGCEFERDEETGKVKRVIGTVKNGPDLIARELFAGLSSWGLIQGDGTALALTEKNCLEFVIHYPEDAEQVLDAVRDFNFINETEEQEQAKKKPSEA